LQQPGITSTDLREIGNLSGRVALECSEVAGQVSAAARQTTVQSELLEMLQRAAQALRALHEEVAEATFEANRFAGEAQGSIAESHRVIVNALSSFGELVDLVAGFDQSAGADQDAHPLQLTPANSATNDKLPDRMPNFHWTKFFCP